MAFLAYHGVHVNDRNDVLFLAGFLLFSAGGGVLIGQVRSRGHDQWFFPGLAAAYVAAVLAALSIAALDTPTLPLVEINAQPGDEVPDCSELSGQDFREGLRSSEPRVPLQRIRLLRPLRLRREAHQVPQGLLIPAHPELTVRSFPQGTVSARLVVRPALVNSTRVGFGSGFRNTDRETRTFYSTRCPYPPPPGVLTVTTSPSSSSRLTFGGSSSSFRRFSPTAPGSPPFAPRGG